MSKIILRGREAIDYAAERGAMLQREAATPGEPSRKISMDEAREIARIEPQSIYVEVEATAHPSDSTRDSPLRDEP